MEEDWSSLIPDLLIKITESFGFYEDLLSFSGVCTSWRSVAAPIRNNFHGPSRFPTLMLAEDDDEDSRKFFLLSNRMIRKVRLPEASKRRCLSSHGWLLIVAEDDIGVKLLHPLTRRQIHLPRLDTLCDYRTNVLPYNHIIWKFTLSSNPCFSLDFHVIVQYGSRGQLAFCKPQDDSWSTPLKEWSGAIYDITYHNEQLYLLDTHGRILTYDIHGSKHTMLVLVSEAPVDLLPHEMIEWLYMLGSSTDDDDKLLVLSRVGYEPRDGSEYEKEDPESWTEGFKVMEFSLKDGTWTKVENLGNRAVFVGYNSSFSIQAFGETIKANCVYYTDDNSLIYLITPKGGGRDMGIYHMSDGSIEPHFNGESRNKITPPTWVEPSL